LDGEQRSVIPVLIVKLTTYIRGDVTWTDLSVLWERRGVDISKLDFISFTASKLPNSTKRSALVSFTAALSSNSGADGTVVA
jgi:hypothetical protein